MGKKDKMGNMEKLLLYMLPRGEVQEVQASKHRANRSREPAERR
jgi:hypothetical protein